MVEASFILMEAVAVDNGPAFACIRFQNQGPVVIHILCRAPGCAAGRLNDHFFTDGGGLLFPLQHDAVQRPC